MHSPNQWCVPNTWGCIRLFWQTYCTWHSSCHQAQEWVSLPWSLPPFRACLLFAETHGELNGDMMESAPLWTKVRIGVALISTALPWDTVLFRFPVPCLAGEGRQFQRLPLGLPHYSFYSTGKGPTGFVPVAKKVNSIMYLRTGEMTTM